VPEDSDALPPQWRAPEPERPVAAAAPAWAEPPVSAAPAVEPDFPAYPAHEAVPQQARAPEPEAEPASSPVKVIEVGGAGEEQGEEAPDAGAGQGQRRGWWRRLIE
jgi:hypothetical protein